MIYGPGQAIEYIEFVRAGDLPEETDPELAAAVMAQFAVMQEKQEDRVSRKRKKKTWENLFDD